MLGLLENIDLQISLLIQKIANPMFDTIAIVMHYIGDNGLLFILISILLMIVKKFRHVGVALFMAQGINGVITTLLKEIVERSRPFIVHPEISPLVEGSAFSSFPSGHASATFAFAIIIGYYFPKTNKFMIGFAVFMCFTRVYAFVHFPTDVIVGGLIGTICAYIAIFITRKFFSKKRFK
ncbi:MAG: phosphatase PAP2 family protein [Mycoplasmatales bacterium]